MEFTAETSNYFPKTTVETKTNLTERTLGNIDMLLKEKGINYYVLGSVARLGYMGESIENKKEIDIVVPDKNKRDDARKIFNEIEDRNSGVEIDDSLSVFFDEKSNGEITLKHGNLEKTVSPEVTKETRIRTGSSSFITFPPETLLHLFILTGGRFRDKDWKNALEFGRWLRKNIIYNHKELEVFHEFGKKQWVESPLKELQYNWRKFVNALPDPVKNTLLSTVYGSDTIKKIRHAYNSVEENTCGYRSKIPDNK